MIKVIAASLMALLLSSCSYGKVAIFAFLDEQKADSEKYELIYFF